MSGEGQSDGITRRSLMRAAGAVAGAGALGLAPSTVAARLESADELVNPRIQEVRKVWEKGYRGQRNRAIGLTDSGIDARHPDLGPWNGVRARKAGENLELVTDEPVTKQVPVTATREIGSKRFSGTAGPGGGVVGFTATTATFEVDESTATDDGIAADDIEGLGVDATLSWNVDNPGPQLNDADFELQRQTANGWETVATSGSGGTEVQDTPTESLSYAFEAAATFRFYVVCWRGETQYDIDATLTADVDTGETEQRTVLEARDFDGDVFPDAGAATPDTAKTVGWYDAGPNYGNFRKPRDNNGHGSHCASIMGGSGRASTLDPDRTTVEEPRAVLTAGDTITYEVAAGAGTGVFVSAQGDAIELVIEGPDGRQLDSSEVGSDTSEYDVNVAEAPVTESGTYTLYVRAAGGEAASTGRVESVAHGAFLAPEETVGDREAGNTTLHAGVAPDASLVGMQGLSTPTVDLGEFAGDFASLFNLRSVNMSWGPQGGLPTGAAGGNTLFGNVLTAIKDAAEEGILSVAAAGNAATPANGNGVPAVADEAISVVSTGPRDGIVAYSSGGIGALDEDDDGTYMKPDVTAPGGALTDLINAAKARNAGFDGEVRDYTGKAGTSMATPFTNGVAGLLAQAMEEDAPENIALPAPADAGFEDTMRLKQVILATASETAFTAAPYHRAHAPTYEFGGRDPYEGYGRVNPDAAIDAVTRDLLPDATALSDEETASATVTDSVGLDVPAQSRAVAGFVEAPQGTLDVSVAHDYYSGGNKGMAKGAPHVDLFVYDAETPAQHGEPNIVASAQGLEGEASVSLETQATRDDPTTEADERTTHVYFVVAKLVNVPGVINGYDVESHLSLDLSFAAADALELPAFSAGGTRSDDGSVFTAGQTNQVDVTLSSVPEELDDDATVRIEDTSPWDVDPSFGDVEGTDGETVDLGTTTAAAVRDGGVTRTYFAEVPETTGQYTFGEASAVVESGGQGLSTSEDTFGGTDTNTVVGASTNTDDATSAPAGESDTVSGTATDAGVDTSDATDAVSDTADSL